MLFAGWSTVSLAQTEAIPFTLNAPDVTYDTTGNLLTAGSSSTQPVTVEATAGTLSAQQLNYNIASNTVEASGNITFTTPSQTSITAESINLSGNLQQGNITSLTLSVPNLGPVATASSASVSGSTYSFNNISYSPCQSCPSGTKPWSVTAASATYNQSTSNVTYRNAQFKVYNTPVLYLPWFQHNLGTKQAKSGLLPPSFGRSEQLGEEITINGYINNASENADYTLRNRLMSKRGSQFIAQRRQVTTHTQSEINASYLNDTGTGKTRSHLGGFAEYDLSSSQRVGINGEVASDDVYLSQYFRRLDPYLASTVYGEDTSNEHYAALSFTRFQDFNTNQGNLKTAQVMPHLQLERWFALDHGAQIELSGDLLNIYRSSGSQSRRMVTQGAYTLPTVLADGSKITLSGNARLDFYNITNTNKNGTITRLLPEVTAKWEKPYLSSSGNHTIAPQVMLAVSPRGGNTAAKVPNEDSVAYELDTSNLFEPNRFAGLDRIETGPRLVYGLDNRWGQADTTQYRFFFGQSLRRNQDSSLPLAGGASKNASDWVGQIEATPNEFFSLTNRFRLDTSHFNPRRSDSTLTIGKVNSSRLQLTHTFLDNGPEEFSSELNLPLTETLTFRSKTRNDLANARTLQTEGALVMAQDCYEIEFGVRRRGFTNGDLQPSTDYMINVQLLTLGN